MHARACRVAAIALAVLLSLPLLVLAQTETGTITGTITDQSGAVLPGTTVTVASPAMIGGERTTTTGPGGSYQFIALPPGTYSLKFELAGFRPVTREGIRITANFIAKVDIAMGMEALAETVNVTGEAPTVDSKSTLIATSLDKGLLDNIPTGRDIWVLTEQVAGAVPDRYNVGGTESAQQTTLAVHGSYAQQDYSINGLSMNWPGGAGNYTMFYFDYDSFDEVQIQTAGASAEVSVGGLYMNMITKSGGDQFHGGTTLMYQPGSMQGNNVPASLKAEGFEKANPIDLIYDLQPTLGGPIAKNAWFFGSYRRYVINTQILGLKRPDGSPEVDVNHQTNALGKVTTQVTPGNKLMAQYYFNYQNRFFRRDNGYGSFTEEKASWRQIEPAHLIQGQWTSVLSKALFLDTRFGYLHQIFPLAYQSSVGPNDISMVDDIRSTVMNAAPQDQSNKATRHQANVSLSYFNDHLAGAHNVKVGFEWMRALNAYDYARNGDLIAHFYDGAPAYVETSNTPLYQESLIRNVSLYAQDAWAIRNRLTLNVGVRFENFKGWNPAQGASGGRFFGARQFTKLDDIPNFNIVVPRLGASYDLRGNGKTAVKATYSRYGLLEGSRFPESLNPNAFSGDLRPWTDLNQDNLPQDNEIGTPYAFFGGASGVRLDPNISRQYSDEVTAGVQHELARDLAVSATYYYRKNQNLFAQLNVAAPTTDAYVPVTVDVPGGGTMAVYNQRPEYIGEVDRVITNQDQFWEKYHGIELTAKKRLSSNWQLLLGYTYSRATSYYVEVPWNFLDATDPNNLVNIDGRRQASDTPHILKVSGTYILPYGIGVSANYRFYTGKPLTRTLLVETLNQGPVSVPVDPRGRFRYPDVSLIDLRVSKVFKLGQRANVEGMFNIFNATNASTVISQVTTLGPYYGQPVQIMTPIVMGLGARFTF